QRRPEAAREIAQFGVVALLQARDFRLQRHAALGAGAGMVLAHFRIHRAEVHRAGRWRGFVVAGAGVLHAAVVARGVGGELVHAARAAEAPAAAAVFDTVRRIGLHRHAAHRVAVFGWRGRGAAVVARGIGGELRRAVRAAEVPAVAGVFEAMG